MMPQRSLSLSPNLLRAAVISAPVTMLGDPPRRVDEVLNIKLKITLQHIEKLADEFGWAPDGGDDGPFELIKTKWIPRLDAITFDADLNDNAS